MLDTPYQSTAAKILDSDSEDEGEKGNLNISRYRVKLNFSFFSNYLILTKSIFL